MEEKTFSPEQPEDVIELFDIVEPVASDDSPVQAEQGGNPLGVRRSVSERLFRRRDGRRCTRFPSPGRSG